MATINLILSLFLGFQSVGAVAEESHGERVLKSASLSRKDMPEDFPYQLLAEGFAIMGLTIQNNSKKEWIVKVEEVEVYSKKGKRMKRALPTDITPKILKYYTGITGYDGHPNEKTVREKMYKQKTIGVRTGQPIVSLDTVEGLRETLERHQLQDSIVGPGETVEGFYYLKSKDTGNKLKGGWLTLGELRAEY